MTCNSPFEQHQSERLHSLVNKSIDYFIIESLAQQIPNWKYLGGFPDWQRDSRIYMMHTAEWYTH